MGMGFAASFADVIDWNDIRKVVPKEATAFQRQLKAAGIDRDVFCHAMYLDDWGIADFQLDDAARDGTIRRITAAWEKLADAFTQKTTVGQAGLELVPGYHAADDGDRYDDVQNGYFHVEGVYQLTPAGEKYADKIKRKSFVTLG